LFALLWLVAAALAAMTVVGLPWARAALHIARWMAWPSHEVPTSTWQQGSNLQDPAAPASVTGYVVWLAVGGLWLALLHHIIAAVLGLTIVGLVAMFPHLALGRVALVLNPGAFRMTVPARGGVSAAATPRPLGPAASESRIQFP
jgi:uncharacterized membrane protein YccF (DUF307 family)